MQLRNGAVVERKRSGTALVLGMLAVGGVLVMVLLHRLVLLLSVAPEVFLVLAMGIARGWWCGDDVHRAARVGADERGLWIDGALVLRRGHVRGGRVVQRTGEPPLVEVSGRFRDREVIAGDIDEACALLVALGIERRKDGRRSTSAGQVRHALVSSVLARGDRSVDAWLGALRSITDAHDYRHAPVTVGQLLEVLDDASAKVEVRAAAATALAALRDPAVRETLRAARENIGSARVRVTLEAALDASEEELCRALERVSRQTTS